MPTKVKSAYSLRPRTRAADVDGCEAVTLFSDLGGAYNYLLR
jgi:hypothetical protein